MRWIKKMDDTFLVVSTSSITVQSLGKIIQCAPAVGVKMWCLFFRHAPSLERDKKYSILNILLNILGKTVYF